VLNVLRGPGEEEVTLYWRLRFDSEARAGQLMRELDAGPVFGQLAHLQYGRDVAIAASTDRDLTAEDLRSVGWGPVPAAVSSPDAEESARWRRSSGHSWKTAYGSKSWTELALTPQ